MPDHTIAVVGGGISGLSAAYYLRQLLPDVAILVFERSARVGGRIATERVDGYLIESGPDAFVTHKPAALEFANALGLSDQIIHSPDHLRPAYIRRGRRLHRLPEGLSGLVPARLGPLFRSRVLSVTGRLRVAMEPWIPPRPASDEPLDQFLTRRFGREAARQLFEPLLGGIYGRTGALSARTTVPQLLDLERQHGSVLRGLRVKQGAVAMSHKLASFADGMAVLPERAKAVLESAGVRVETGREITGLSIEDRFLRLVPGADGEIPLADAVVIALPVQATSGLLGRVAPAASGILANILTTSSAVVALGFSEAAVSRTLDASGYVVAGQHKRPVTACTWSSVKFERRAPVGSCLFRVFFGGEHYQVDSPADSDLIEMASDELRETTGVAGSPNVMRVHRHDGGTPQLLVGHAARMAALGTALRAIDPPVELAGNYHGGVGIADAVAAGRFAAQRIADRLRKLR